MPSTVQSVTERLLKLKPGGTCVINAPRLSYQAALKHAPERAWRAERVEGGLVVTRVR